MNETKCKTCAWWRSGYCERVDADLPGQPVFAIVVTVADDHDLDARLKTGPEFGCVLHVLPEK